MSGDLVEGGVALKADKAYRDREWQVVASAHKRTLATTC